MKEKKTAIIILQYKNYQDTLECLESILHLKNGLFQIIVVDNDSPGDCVQPLSDWAGNAGQKSLLYPAGNRSPFSGYLAIQRPVTDQAYDLTKKIYLLKNNINSGFAGGNNLGIKFAKNILNSDYFWILNNDTTVEPGSLSSLVDFYNKSARNNLPVGIAGSKIRYYHHPTRLQGVGGKYNPFFATSIGWGEGEEDTGQYDKEIAPIDFPIGAAMFVSGEFIDKVGLMPEDYFLYFEELDWTIRAWKKGFSISYCPKSIVYHKEGGSIGSSINAQKRSEISDYYQLRNRIRFTLRNKPLYLVTVVLGFIGVIINRIRRGEWKKVALVFKALLSIPYNKDVL